MSFYTDASLVMIPSGYKDQKVYCAKPVDGSADLTFSRASSATRVNSAGLIEKVRTNLIKYSEQFDNAVWTKNDVTVTANAGTAPDGTSTADLFVPNTNNVFHNIIGLASNNFSVTAGVEYSNSFYAKANGYRYIQHIWSGGLFSGAAYANIDLQTGTVTAGDTANTTVESLGSGWYRIKTVMTCATSGTSYVQFGAIDSGTSARAYSFVANGTDGYLIWGAQAESGVATDYIATTSSAVSVGPVANLPRLDYSGGATCPKLLLEPQRTNALTFSESFDNAAWSVKDNTTVTANTTATLDPSGYYGADKLVENSANAQHRIYRSIDGTGGTFSFFAKAAERSWVAVLSNNGNFTYFDIGNGTIGTVAATSTATITPYGNEWYRCTVYNTHSSFGSLIQLALANNGTAYQGDGTSGAYIFGAQFEASATYATSYIPTLGASVTRGADEAYKTSITSLIGQTEGTIFVDLAGFNGSAHLITLGDGTSANYIMLYIDGSSIAWFSSGGLTGSGGTVTANSKAALAYKGNSSALYLDGVQILTNTSSTIPSLPNMYINNNAVLSNINKLEVKQALLFKTRLTNAQCQELTSL